MCPVTLTESFSSDPHVDHDPLHDASDTEEHGEEPVRPETTFARHKAQEVSDVWTPLKHAGQREHMNRDGGLQAGEDTSGQEPF